jgi:hypothetical protein
VAYASPIRANYWYYDTQEAFTEILREGCTYFMIGHQSAVFVSLSLEFHTKKIFLA